MKFLDLDMTAHYADPEMFSINVQVTYNNVGNFMQCGAASQPRRDAFSDEVWQRIEWASRALLSALSEAKPIKPKKPRQLARVITLPTPAVVSKKRGRATGDKQAAVTP